MSLAIPRLGLAIGAKRGYDISLGASFDPTTIPNLQAWFSSTYGVVHTDNVVESWEAKYPADGLVVSTAFNGPMVDGDSIYFDGVGSYMVSEDLSISSSTPRTFVVVGKMPNSIDREQEGFMNINDDCGYVFKESYSERMYLYVGGGGQVPNSNGANTNLSDFRTVVAVQKVSPDESYIKVGESVRTGTLSHLPILHTLYFGCRSPSSEFLLGNIKDVLIFDRALTSTEISNLETYLA